MIYAGVQDLKCSIICASWFLHHFHSTPQPPSDRPSVCSLHQLVCFCFFACLFVLDSTYIWNYMVLGFLCLSFHLAYYPLGLSILLQMVRFQSFKNNFKNLFIFRERGWERERAKEIQWLVASCIHPNQGLNLQPGIKPVTFCCVGCPPIIWATPLMEISFFFIAE